MNKKIQIVLVLFAIAAIFATVFSSTGIVQARPNLQATATPTEEPTKNVTPGAPQATRTSTPEATSEPTGTSTAAPTVDATETDAAEPTSEAPETGTPAATAEATGTADPSAATATPTAATAPEGTDDDAAALAYCQEQGGTVTTRYPAWNTNAAQAQWLRLAGSRDFCTFLSEADSTGFQSHIEIAVDTLYAEEPSLAVFAYREPVALPPFTGANPSTLYCSKLGGTDLFGGQDSVAGGGWVTDAPDSATHFQVVSMCMFADGSAIDSWGLTYKANGVVRGTDLSEVVRYQPGAQPPVFVGGSNKPSADTVDQTLTDADNGRAVTMNVGDTLTVQLNSNPSTGFSWQVISTESGVLEQVGEPQFDLGSKTPVPGAGGTETFTFRAQEAGTATLTLLYSRPWETDTTPTPQNTWTTEVTVE